MNRPLNPKHLDALVARGLDPETIVRLGIFSARRAADDANEKTPIPDAHGTIVGYPYYDENSEEANIKYIARRGDQKLAFQKTGGRKIFYNLGCLTDPALQDPEGPAAVIFEGENDTIAGISAGHPWSIGVPEGGSPDRTEAGKPIPMKPDEELDPNDDKKFEFITNGWDVLAPVRKIVLWLDWDGVGQRLRDELSRRLDKVRCYVVHRPAYMNENVVKAKVKDKVSKEVFEIMRPPKDANEVLQYYGAQAVLDCIAAARPIPMTGLYKMSDFEDRQLICYSTGIKALDPHLKMYDTAFSVVSGLPQSGKSLLWNQIAFNMAELYGWPVVIGSFEADPRPELQRQLRSFYIKKDRRDWSHHDVKHADDFIETYFTFINRDPSGIEDVQATPEWCVEQIENAVIRYGVKMAILDPWNQLDHRRKKGEMRDEYTIDRIRMLKDAGRRMRVATTIIAHPTAEAGRAAKEGNVLSMYDMADGAAWNNAAEYGMIVHRRGMRREDRLCEPFVRKVKFQQATDCYPGNCSVEFIPEEGRFDPDLVSQPIDEEADRADRQQARGR